NSGAKAGFRQIDNLVGRGVPDFGPSQRTSALGIHQSCYDKLLALRIKGDHHRAKVLERFLWLCVEPAEGSYGLVPYNIVSANPCNLTHEHPRITRPTRAMCCKMETFNLIE